MSLLNNVLHLEVHDRDTVRHGTFPSFIILIQLFDNNWSAETFTTVAHAIIQKTTVKNGFIISKWAT